MSEEPRILAIDDEPHALTLLRINLEAQGMQVLPAADGAGALARLQAETPDVVLLDLGLPDIDGFDLLQRIRARTGTPIIIVTVRNDEADRIRGLELGADDYVVKPFSFGELSARIQAVLRRTRGEMAAHRLSAIQRVVDDDYLRIDFVTQTAHVGGREVGLRPTENRLLQLLAENAGHTVSYATLLQQVWGPEYEDETNYVHLYITYLRQKLEPEPSQPRYILTQRGLGYKFRRLDPERAPW
ncbi:MAG TPA: response regulator transcription factor [Chloroflexota bacterium]|jgi:two-component system KDP operon response regulator KdpE